jgi:hypothetical protein
MQDLIISAIAWNRGKCATVFKVTRYRGVVGGGITASKAGHDEEAVVRFRYVH